MSKQLANSAVIDFVAEVHHNFQGKERLNGTCRLRRGITGDQTRFPVMGKGTARQRTAPQVKLDLMNVAHSRVTCALLDYNASDMTDIWDQAEVNFDEKRELATVISGGLGRRRDQTLLDAMIAARTAGTITKTVAATGFGGEATLNLERVLEAGRLLGLDEAFEQGRTHIVVHYTDVAQALQLLEFGSSDYNSLRALMDGKLEGMTFLGFKWHVLGDRGEEGGLGLTAGLVRQCFAWHEDAVGCASGNLREFDISWLGDYGSWITSGFMKIGACVIDPRGVVEILCNET